MPELELTEGGHSCPPFSQATLQRTATQFHSKAQRRAAQADESPRHSGYAGTGINGGRTFLSAIFSSHTSKNCNAVPLQSPASRSARWVDMDKNNEPQRGSTMNQSRGILEIICGTPLGFNHRGGRYPSVRCHASPIGFARHSARWALEFNAVGVKARCAP